MYDGTETLPLGDKLWAVPIGILWGAGALLKKILRKGDMSNTIIVRRKGITEIIPSDTIGRSVTFEYNKSYEAAKPAQSDNDARFGFGEGFLNEARKNRAGIRIKLADGEQLSGVISAFDNDSIYFLLSPDHKETVLLYKHAIAVLESDAE